MGNKGVRAKQRTKKERQARAAAVDVLVHRAQASVTAGFSGSMIDNQAPTGAPAGDATSLTLVPTTVAFHRSSPLDRSLALPAEARHERGRVEKQVHDVMIHQLERADKEFTKRDLLQIYWALQRFRQRASSMHHVHVEMAQSNTVPELRLLIRTMVYGEVVPQPQATTVAATAPPMPCENDKSTVEIEESSDAGTGTMTG